jgi:hypothetical protein
MPEETRSITQPSSATRITVPADSASLLGWIAIRNDLKIFVQANSSFQFTRFSSCCSSDMVAPFAAPP